MREIRQGDGTIRYEHGARAAVLSECGTYRYLLEREIAAPFLYPRPATVLFVMLNPSTADAMQDDPTVRRQRDHAPRGDGLGAQRDRHRARARLRGRGDRPTAPAIS